MNLRIAVYGCSRWTSLMMRLREYDARVKDGDGTVYVYANGLTNREYSEVMTICSEYGRVEKIDEI